MNVTDGPATLSIGIATDAPLDDNMDESYRLTIMHESISLESQTVWGALRGLETFAQLLEWNGRMHLVAMPAEITDRPRLRWRGLLIDTARHWWPLPRIIRAMDAMAALKLNALWNNVRWLAQLESTAFRN